MGLMEDHALYFLKVYWLSLRSISIPFLPLSPNKKKILLLVCMSWMIVLTFRVPGFDFYQMFQGFIGANAL